MLCGIFVDGIKRFIYNIYNLKKYVKTDLKQKLYTFTVFIHSPLKSKSITWTLFEKLKTTHF